MEDLKVYGNAVIDGTLTQTGNANLGGNLDITGTLTFDGGGVAISSILDQDNMSSDSATALATQQSIKKYVDDVAGSLVTNVDRLAGWLMRPKFTFVDTDTITIGAGRYHLLGTAQGEDIYKWDSALTFDFGSGGSNASSSALGASEWHYLYIDDSSLTGGSDTALVASNFLNSTTAPIWDASECGWYNGADRCISAFYSNASSQLEEFFHINRDITWGNDVDLGVTFTTSWTDLTMRVPAFATNLEAMATVWGTPGGSYYYHYWRTNGQSSGTGHRFAYSYNSGGGDNRRDNTLGHYRLITDTSGVIEIKCSNSSTSASDIFQHGYALPEGM